MDNSKWAIGFILLLNELFDSLNSRRPAKAIKNPGYILALEKAKLWLDAWEAHIDALLKEDRVFFLGKPTVAAPRLSQRRAIDLSSALLDDGFFYTS